MLQGWRLVCLLAALMSAVTSVICWLAIPDFARIASYRLDATSGPVISAPLPGAHRSDQMLYLPSHGGRIYVTLGADRVLGAVPTVAGSQLTRDRAFGLMTIPADLADPSAPLLRLEQREIAGNAPLSPVYLGPADAIAPVANQQRLLGRAMQLFIPSALIITICISFLLIFFSYQPLRFVFLIAALSIQLVLEIADEPLLAEVSIVPLVPFLSVLVNGLIGLAIAVWASGRTWHWQALIGSTLLVLAVRFWLRVIAPDLSPAIPVIDGVVFAAWLAFIHALGWVMIIGARGKSGAIRAAALATLLFSNTALVAYQLIKLLRPDIGTVFFLSNWTNVATSGAVLCFTGGALFSEINAYRNKIKHLQSLELIVSGHNAALDEQAFALRSRIEHGAVLEERQRFLRDMHDGLGGQLLTLLLRLRSAEGGAAVLADDVQAIIGDLRLMTSALDDDGASLISALGKLRERISVQCDAADITLNWEMDLPLEIEGSVGLILNILRIVEEGATNTVRHSNANTLTIAFSFAGVLAITMSDDGTGFDQAEIKPGTGLRSFAQRVSKLNGTLSIETAPGRGTTIAALIPMPQINRTAPASQASVLREPLRSSI